MGRRLPPCVWKTCGSTAKPGCDGFAVYQFADRGSSAAPGAFPPFIGRSANDQNRPIADLQGGGTEQRRGWAEIGPWTISSQNTTQRRFRIRSEPAPFSAPSMRSKEDVRQPNRASAAERRETGGGIKHSTFGRHTGQITARLTEAQKWFDLGLNWCFAFNHEEGVKCFQKALEADPGCVLAHWGVAYGLGPFYNLAWRELGEREAASAIVLAYDHLRPSAPPSGTRHRPGKSAGGGAREPLPEATSRFPGRNTTAGTTTTRPKCGGYITPIPTTMKSWCCLPKPSLPAPRVGCGMSKPGCRPAAPTWSRRLPSANGRSRWPPRPGDRSIRRSPISSSMRWRCPTSPSAPWPPPTRSRRSALTPGT